MTSIVLWVSDLEKQSRFYGALLAGEVTSPNSDFAMISNGKDEVLLHLLPGEFQEKDGAHSPRDEVAIKPIFHVGNIEESRELIAKLGGAVPREIMEYSGAYYLDCIDPEGNVIQLSN